MSKQEFEDFIINNGQDISEVKKASKKLIAQVHDYFSEIYADISENDDYASEKITVGSDGASTITALTRHIDGEDISLKYIFDDKKEKVIVYFNHESLRCYSLSNNKMINSSTDEPFEISDIEKDLDRFK